jgi:hypothetical protein
MVSVIVRGVSSSGETEASPSSCDHLRLLDGRAREQAPDSAPDAQISLQANEVARHFSVKPGDYVLSFRSVTGETLQQTVPALPGRRTLIFQEEFRAKVFVAEGEVFRDQWRLGVDPGRTIIITVNGSEEHERIRERLRLADTLLHGITTGSTSLDPKFIGILDDPKTDPLLRLLGAIVAIRDLTSAGKARMQESTAPVSAEQALRWLSLDRGLSFAQDETAGAWLCWRASATKAAEASIHARVEMNARIQDLVKMATQLATRPGLSDSQTLSRILTPELRHRAQTVLDTLLSPANQHLFGSILEKNPSLGQVFEQMQQLSTTLAASRQESAPPSAGHMPTPPEQAPGLSRMIVFPDDPHKARFGGTAAREGFILSASFANTRQPGWTRITLSINGPARDGETIRLYLHESFPEPVQDLMFSKQKASTSLLAWGGFTVGGWLPDRGIELELDLAECDGAPEPIRTR